MARPAAIKLIRPETLDVEGHQALRIVDQVASGFGVLSFREGAADGQDTAADAVLRVEHRDVRSHGREIARGGKAGESCACDENRDA